MIEPIVQSFSMSKDAFLKSLVEASEGVFSPKGWYPYNFNDGVIKVCQSLVGPLITHAYNITIKKIQHTSLLDHDSVSIDLIFTLKGASDD